MTSPALLPPPMLVGVFDWPPALMAPFPSSQLRARGRRLQNSSNPPTKRRRGRPAFTPAPAAASPGLASASVLLRFRLSNRSPGFDVFFYSGHPTIFPASFISSMDSLQSFISSFTQLHREFASNSATSALPLLCSLAPPIDIHPRNIRPGSSLRVRCITLFSFLNIYMTFKHTVFPTPLLHSGRF
ncbi:hypothetical protein ATANTOWER_023058 [Ataeniobius toweri]|uniref:Uncharacterized protein n=1 Tax=Ataeniobius toweri TaxID=208326 RepID=A0ABU7CM83_9TELE|nr:hypothetical protein [Ataeniobius toweri]